MHLRRNFHTKAFKGSVFVECESPEAAAAIVAGVHTLNGEQLKVMMKCVGCFYSGSRCCGVDDDASRSRD